MDGAQNVGKVTKPCIKELKGKIKSEISSDRCHVYLYFRSNCTYCGGDIEDNFSSFGLAAAILLFPIGMFRGG